MAKAKKLPSGQWRALVYSHTELIDGKQKRKYESFTADTKKEAEFLAAQFAKNKSLIQSSKITVGDALERYIKSKEKVLSPSTIRGYKCISLNHLNDLKDIYINKLTSEQIQKALQKEALSVSPKTTANIYGLLSATLDMFAPEKVFRVSLPQRTKKEHYIPNDTDIQLLLDSIKGTELEKAVLLAAFGSLRRSEISPLTDKDIDFNNNTITVSKAMVNAPDATWRIKAPKTNAGYRSVVFPPFVIEHFKNIKGPLVQLTPQQITDRFTKALLKEHLPHFRFHDLRHYQASILHALNIPNKYIMKRGGWSSEAVLNGIYKHTLTDKEQEFNNIVINYFEKMQHEMQHKK